MKKWILGFLALVVLLALAGFWWMRENPLRLYEMMTRRALETAGLELASFDASSGSIAYWEGGEGPTLVLLHGAGDQSGAFQGVVPSLLEDYRLLLVDIPGHGDSEPVEGPLPMSLMYGGVEELVGALAGDEPPTLIGSSMGAWISMLYARSHPEAVDRVIAVNGGPLVGERPDLSLTPTDREAARKLMEAIRDPSSPPTPDFLLDDIVERSAAGPIGRISTEVEDLTAHLLDGKLGEVTVPVELVWGESDQLLPLTYAQRMLAGLPRARLTKIPGCGHIPANECPDKLADVLKRLLAMPPPEPAAAPEDPAEGSAVGGSPEEAQA